MTDSARVYETDWLGYPPVFYNTSMGAVGHSLPEVLDPGSIEIDPVGFNDFLRFGFSVFGRTPVRDIRFLRHSSRLTVGAGGELKVEERPDPVDEWIGKSSEEDEVLGRIQRRVSEWENRCEGRIILPLSGGFDSRLLASMINDGERVRAYSYGLSRPQSLSTEVVYAREVARRLGFEWMNVELGGFHRYLDEWDQLFGAAVHAHGMYHLEFYREVVAREGTGHPLLSGIIGDAWSGNVRIPAIESPRDVEKLAYTHGVHASVEASRFSGAGSGMEEYFEAQRERLRTPAVRVVEAMRIKMMLLSYLFRVPQHLGFRPWSPFLDIDIAMSMLSLPPERRADRRWQREYFARRGLDIEASPPPARPENTLDLQGLAHHPPPALNVEPLSEVVDAAYAQEVNRVLREARPLRFSQLKRVPLLRRLVRRWDPDPRTLEAYNSYVTLRPIDRLLSTRRTVWAA